MIYTMGANDLGQLGRGVNATGTEPQPVVLPESRIPVTIACGRYHGLVVTDRAYIYGWGSNALDGGLAVKSQLPIVWSPLLVELSTDSEFVNRYVTKITAKATNLAITGPYNFRTFRLI